MRLKSSLLLIVFWGFSVWFCQSCFDSISYAQPDTPEPTNDSVIDAIKFEGGTGTISVNQETNTVYITNSKARTVSIIDGTKNSVIDSIPVDKPFEMAINTDSNKVYVTFYGTKELTIIKGHEAISQDSPLKQISSGIDPYSVTCKEDFELVFKSTDNSPACVKPSTAEKLIQRGWARE